MIRKLTDKPIAIAADHRGADLKTHLKTWLAANGYTVTDHGTNQSAERVDAMDYAVALAAEIQAGRCDFAIGICGSGQMMAITANRFPFIRATLLHTPDETLSARQHGDANMLVLGADLTPPGTAERILATFLNTAAEGDRYAERRERLAKLDISALKTLCRKLSERIERRSAPKRSRLPPPRPVPRPRGLCGHRPPRTAGWP